MPVRILAWPAFGNRSENPYTASLYAEIERLGATVDDFTGLRALVGRYDVLHVHWVDHLLGLEPPILARVKAEIFLALVRLRRRRGVTVVWTIHNLTSHESSSAPGFATGFWRRFLASIDAHISLSKAAQAQAEDAYPALRKLPGFVIPHAHYRGSYPNETTRADARRALELAGDSRVVAFVGKIRAYKNVAELVRAFRQLTDDGAVLVVAGDPAPAEIARTLSELASGDERIRLHLGAVPDARMQLYLNAADVVVLPYTRILNSGSALLALSFDRPVLLPETPGFSELRENVGDAWVRTFPMPLSAGVLEEALAWSAEERARSAPLAAYDGAAIARATLAAYNDAMRSSASSTRRSQEKPSA